MEPPTDEQIELAERIANAPPMYPMQITHNGAKALQTIIAYAKLKLKIDRIPTIESLPETTLE
jgi:hypothetical protein